MKKPAFLSLFFSLAATLLSLHVHAQTPNDRTRQQVRTVSIPISIYTKKEMREGQSEEYIQADRLIVREDKHEQTILSIRSVTEAPLSLAVLVQDDLSSDFNLQIKDLIRSLPIGSRVMVAYVRGGSLQIRQRFTDDLAKAADSLRVVFSNSAA